MSSRKEKIYQIIRAEQVLKNKKLQYLKEFYPDCYKLIADTIDWENELHNADILDTGIVISKEEADKHVIKVPSNDYSEYSDEMML